MSTEVNEVLHSNPIEEISSEKNDNNDCPIIPERRKSTIRNLIGFWLLGLCNNYPYVIMLSAAFDLLHPAYSGGGKHNNETLVIQNETRCNEVSTGAILLADIIPSFCIKLAAPFIGIKTQSRAIISIILCSMSFIITSLSFNNGLTFLGVICASLSSGLGEVTFLSYSSFFDKNVVSAWSSGTGGAGVIGALSYAGLTAFFHIRQTLQVMLIMPVLTTITFWIVLDHPPSVIGSCRDYMCSSEMKPMLGNDIDLSTVEYIKPQSYTFKEKIKLVKPLLKYMIPLGLVYFAEYFINQGLMELLYFPNVSSWLPHENQYRWYQVDYQVGVLVSRSSVNILQINKLWILPILQVINALLLLLNVCFSYIPSIWIVLVVIFYEGLLGGSAYVNTFYKISTEINAEHREFSMGAASLADSIGIALAGIVSLPVHDALCKLPSYAM